MLIRTLGVGVRRGYFKRFWSLGGFLLFFFMISCIGFSFGDIVVVIVLVWLYVVFLKWG